MTLTWREAVPGERLPEPETDDEPAEVMVSEAEPGPVKAQRVDYTSPEYILDEAWPEATVARWRSASDEDETDAGGRGRGRRRRRRRGGDRREDGPEVRTTAKPAPASEEAVAAPPEPEPEPVKAETPVRTRISIPLDAAQVVSYEGLPTLIRDRAVLEPLAFYTGEAASRASQEELALAGEHGCHLHFTSVKLVPGEEPGAQAKAMSAAVKEIVRVDAEAQVVLRVEFEAPADWNRRWPESQSGRRQPDSQPSLCDEGYWALAKETLQSCLRTVLASPEGKSLFGIHLDRNEWVQPQDHGVDASEAARVKFGAWLRQKYRNDIVSLRAAWFDGRVEFDTVQVPLAKRNGSGMDFVRLDRKARRYLDSHLFLSDVTVERIADLAHGVKEASDGRLAVGVSYGFTFEWSHPSSGHLSLGKLLRTPEVDFIAGPPSYKSRGPGGSAAFPWPVDSALLNGKLAISEEDFRTPIGRSGHDPANPEMRTPQALEAAHWRGVGAALAHGTGLCWMDDLGEGWLNSRGIWERGRKVRRALQLRASAQMTAPDVALLIDERSLAYLADERAFEILVQNVRESLLRSGLSVGFYLLSDLAHRENFPESRLYVFVNAWDIRPEVRTAIKTKLQRDDKVLLWLYSAGLFEGGRESLERVREVTGIALRPQPFNSKPGTTLLNLRDPLCRVLPEGKMAEGGTLEPSYYAIPEDASTLGEYSQTGLPSFVVRRFPSPGTQDEPWTSVFMGEPVVTPGFFRALAEMAGGHVWSHDDDLIHVRAPFLTLHCSGAGLRTITLPDKWSCYDLIQELWMPVENSSLKFVAMDGATHVFAVGHKADIEAMLAGRPVERLDDEAIQAHQDNTVHWDSVQYEVQVMKLDEWVVETWSEELADDLLLKPSM
ncbi:MAG: hypothetical protein MH204_03185, partial [Fimbriimonadaceae bacterium]|nr:hypothetical protein [Fimbriimonadaceae bacterium]